MQYLQIELEQERQRCQSIEIQWQYEMNLRIQNEQLYFADVSMLREQNEEFKMRCQELEYKVRENSMQNQDQIREATSRIALLSIEVERLNQLSQRRFIENEQLKSQMDSKVLAMELSTIQKLVEELKNELINKQKTIHNLQDQLQIQNNAQSTQKLIKQDNNIEQQISLQESIHSPHQFRSQQMHTTNLKETESQRTESLYNKKQTYQNQQPPQEIVKQYFNYHNNQINALSQILEDKDQQIHAQQIQFDNLYNEFNQINSQIRHSQDENKNLRAQIDSCYREIERLNKLLISRNQEIQEAFTQDWKRNFQDINVKYHKVQEELCLTQAELEASRATQKMYFNKSDK